MTMSRNKALFRFKHTTSLLLLICLLGIYYPAPAIPIAQVSEKFLPWIIQYDMVPTDQGTTKLVPADFSPFYQEKKHFWNIIAGQQYPKYEPYWFALASMDSNALYPSLYNVVDFHDERHFTMKIHNREKTNSIQTVTDLYVRYQADSFKLDYIGRFSHRNLNMDGQWMGHFPFINIDYAGYLQEFDLDTLLIDRHLYAYHLNENSFQLLAYLPWSLPPYTTDRKKRVFFLDQYQDLCSYDVPSRQFQWKTKIAEKWKRPSEIGNDSSYFTLIQPYFTSKWLLFRADTHIGFFSSLDGTLQRQISLNELHPQKALALLPPIQVKDAVYYFYSTNKEERISIHDLHLLVIHGKDSPTLSTYRISSPHMGSINAIAFLPALSGFWIKTGTQENGEVVYYDIP
jgi:hypothetical protein